MSLAALGARRLFVLLVRRAHGRRPRASRRRPARCACLGLCGLRGGRGFRDRRLGLGRFDTRPVAVEERDGDAQRERSQQMPAHGLDAAGRAAREHGAERAAVRAVERDQRVAAAQAAARVGALRGDADFGFFDVAGGVHPAVGAASALADLFDYFAAVGEGNQAHDQT
jgi:hypothetical protein